MFTSLCQFGLGVAVAFSGNYYFFVVLRFLLAMVSLACVCRQHILCNFVFAGSWGTEDRVKVVTGHKISSSGSLCAFPDLQNPQSTADAF